MNNGMESDATIASIFRLGIRQVGATRINELQVRIRNLVDAAARQAQPIATNASCGQVRGCNFPKLRMETHSVEIVGCTHGT
jgi:hypothetical protein